MRNVIQLALVGLVVAGIGRGAGRIEFSRDIRPILSENCFACHGPDRGARQAGLRLDRRDQALARGAIIPGDSAASKIIQRVLQANPALAMPPVATDKHLTRQQKDMLAAWIDQGAEYQEHWAHRKPRRPDAPRGPAGVDFLVDRRLADSGLEPVAEAERRTLARRLGFDLTGLPPSANLVESYVRDRRPDAYERLLDSFFDSPHYGERMAVHWLDLVRYADTVGYHGDVPVNLYPYREYVIRSFNENKPFDVMTREQLAGDLLPDPTSWQRVASGYNRLSRMTNEGGSQAEEYLAKYAADRVRNVSTVWLGSTLGCAECHDHKFDPFLATDFYSMAAFFADIEEQGVFGGTGNWGSHVRVLVPRDVTEAAEIDRGLSRLREAGAGRLPASPESLETLAGYLAEDLRRWRALEPDRIWADCAHPDFNQCDRYDLREEPDSVVRVVLADETEPRESLHRIEIPLEDETLTALALELFPTGDFDSFYLSDFEVRLLGRADWPIRIEIQTLLPDREGPDSMLRDTLDGNYHTGWHGKWGEDRSRVAAFGFKAPLRSRPGERLQVSIFSNPRGRFGPPARFRLLGTDSPSPELPARGVLRDAVLASGERTAEQRKALAQAFDRIVGANANWMRIRALERRSKVLADRAYESLVAKAVEEPRATRVLPRGDWMDRSGPEVLPQVPRFLGRIDTEGRRLNRLDLANWLVDPDNPLVARVFVNRLWKMFFGTGLSKTLDDLGSQGEPPPNQELLDWLAVEFVESGWDIRHMARTMLLSRAYRRSSQPSAELLAADPYNRLHGRQTMQRLAAEFIRDNALAVSGLLNPRVGGPSVKPYQPTGYYRELNFPKRVYEPDLSRDQFRRGLYTHWQRQYLHPALMAFDAPAREECAADREVSNTPLQSLVLLNDPSFVEAAWSLALRILREGGKTDRKRVDFAFRQAFSRSPVAAERTVITTLLARQRQRFSTDPSQANRLLGTGISPVPREVPGPELAAWTGVARALFNKHEFLMRY